MTTLLRAQWRAARRSKATAMVAPIHFTEGGDQMGEQYSGYIAAFTPSGEKMGWIDYAIINDSRFEDGKVHIQYVEVDPRYRRQGVASALLDKLRQDNPGLEVDPGMLTGEGSAWWRQVVR